MSRPRSVSGIYGKVVNQRPVNKTAARVVSRGTGRRKRGRKVECDHCGILIKIDALQRHLLIEHGIPSTTKKKLPQDSVGRTIFKNRSKHLEEKQLKSKNGETGRCICDWCGLKVPIRKIDRHTRKKRRGKEKRIRMTSDDPRWRS